jgi:RNA polymerase sigma-70 factor (ECF subfamily)
MSIREGGGAGGDDEIALVASLQAGDDAAFEKLVRSFGGRMLAVARRMLRSEEDAQDALQEAFLSAFRAIGGFKGDARLSTWLHRIVVNAALMKLRSRKRGPETAIEELLPRYLEDGHHETPPAEWRETGPSVIEKAELRQLVRDSIARLPENYRTVLLLRDIEELDTQETAQMLGISQNAVKIRLHRARQALQGLLDPHLREAL